MRTSGGEGTGMIWGYFFTPFYYRLPRSKYEKPAIAGTWVLPWYTEIRVKSSPDEDEYEDEYRWW